MKILSLETSAKSVSAAVTDGEKLLAYAYQSTGLTHSRTLMPMVEAMLQNSDLSLSDMEAVAVSAGPGSFTGLRIGVAAAKGLAWAQELPCCGVSTLEAMAQNAAHMDALVICAMDARRSQIYNALFLACDGSLTRLVPDRAIALDALLEEIKDDPRPKVIVGDGAQLTYDYLSKNGVACKMAPQQIRMQNAAGVGFLAQKAAAENALVSAQELTPVYLRLSQAERERLEREKQA